MLYRVFDTAELPALVSAFMDGYEVVARVRKQVYVRRKPDRRPAQGASAEG